MSYIQCITENCSLQRLNCTDVWLITLGAVLMYALTILLKLIINKTKMSTSFNWVKNFTLKFFRSLLTIISIDYVISKKQKTELELKYCIFERKESKDVANEEGKTKYKIARSKYIKTNNIANLITSSIIVVIVLVFVYVHKVRWLWMVFGGLLFYRVVSRTMEINLSFLLDIIGEKERQSSLSGRERMCLALKSLLEEAVLFVGMYAVLRRSFLSEFFWTCITAGARSFIPTLPDGCASIVTFIATYQAICSLILITLSLASYISEKSD